MLVIGRDGPLGAEPAEGRIAPAVIRLIYEIGGPLLIVPPHAPAEGRALLAREPDIFFQRTIHMCLLLGLFHALKRLSPIFWQAEKKVQALNYRFVEDVWHRL